jgi:cytochrome c biogenesis protein
MYEPIVCCVRQWGKNKVAKDPLMQEKRLNISDYVDSWWRFLASIKLTVVLLLFLAALSIIGTVIPQNISAQEYLRLFGIFRTQLILLLDIDNMYQSWWFQALLVMLVINIVVCSIDRLQDIWKTIFVKNPQFNLQAFRNRKSRREFQVERDAGELEEPFRRLVAKSFRYTQMVPVETGFAITAEKGRWTRLGVYAVHLSVIVMLVGGLIGSRFGFEGYVPIPEGESADTIQLHSTGLRKQLPFTIRNDAFTLEFYEGTRRPKAYRSDLTILENGQAVQQKQIAVNSPLYHQRIGIFQSSYGRIDDRGPTVAPMAEAPDEIELIFRSAESGMIYTRTAHLGQPIDIPERLGTLVLERYEPDADFRGMDLGPTFFGTLTAVEGDALTVTLPYNFPRFDTMRGGSVIISVSNSNVGAASRQERYYTGLQVSYDPGVHVVYAGFVLMIVGCWVAFFMSHKRVVVEVTAMGKQSHVMVSGTANKNKMGFEDDLRKIIEQLTESANRSGSV